MSAPGKPWWEYLLDLLAGLLAQQDLARAGAGPAALAGAVTGQAALPTFAAGERQPPAGVEESRDLADAHPLLVQRYLALKEDFARQTGRTLFETSTWRSAARQHALYQVGRRGVPGERTVTQIDGVHAKSRHMPYPAQAVDVCVDADPGPGKHAVWDHASYEPLGPLAAQHGLVWGGSWHMDDYPHLELPAEAA